MRKKLREDESFTERKKRKKKGQQGKKEENDVNEALNELKAEFPLFDFDRLLDARAAGRPVPPTVADFTFCCDGLAGALEVKSTEHDFRLPFGGFPQFPRMRRRAEAGALCLVAVRHSTTKLWRIVDVSRLEVITNRSWDLRWCPTVPDFKTEFVRILEGMP